MRLDALEHARSAGALISMLRLGAMWPPGRSSSSQHRLIYALYSALFLLFTFVNILGEIGGLLMVPGTLEKKCQSICSALFRTLCFTCVALFLCWARPIQDLLKEIEELNSRDFGGMASKSVQRLRTQADDFSRRLLLCYSLWFTYSSVGVVTQPAVEWLVVGRPPHPFLSSDFWLLGVQADTLPREIALYLCQSVSQFASTIAAVSYCCFFGGLAVNVSYQAQILCVLIDSIQFSKARSACKSDPVRKQFVHCIKFHQEILLIADKMNSYVRIMVLVLVLSSLGFMSTMLYQMAVVPPTQAGFVATAMILICTNLLVGLFCYSSDRLQSATLEVIPHLMGSDWTEAPQPLKRLIPIVICRAARPASLWCWRFSSISLPTLLQVQNKAYSMFAVMRSFDK